MGGWGDHRTVQVVTVVMMMVINGQAGCGLAEQFDECRVTADLFGMTGAAHMAVQAHHLIGRTHDQVQVVGNHQYAATQAVAQSGDEVVQLRLPYHVNTLHRLVQHQQLRLSQQRTGQQHTLHFTPGHSLDGTVDHVLGADLLKRRQGRCAIHARYQAQKAQHRQRQRGVDLDFLRHVANAQPGFAPYRAAVWLE